MILYALCDEHELADMQARWSKRPPSWVAFVPLRSPPMARHASANSVDMPEAVLDEMFSIVAGRTEPERRYAFLGHRYGSWIALQLARRFLLAGRTGPRHLFLTGANPPHVSSSSYGRHDNGWRQLPCRISVLSSKGDTEVMPDRLSEWSRYASGRCDIHLIEDGAGAPFTQSEELIQSCISIFEREYAHGT